MTITNNGYDSKNNSSPVSLTSDAEEGDGGGNMAIWTAPREDQLNTLLVGGSVKLTANNADFSIPAGATLGNYSQTLAEAEYSLTQPPFESASGSGGGTMTVWESDRTTQLEKLVIIVPNSFTNSSAYPTPGGAKGYGMNVSSAEYSLSQPTAGVEKGPNVSGSINFDGSLLVVRDPDDPGNLPTFPVPDADITIQPLPVGGLDNDTLSNSDGTYLVPVPRKTDTTEYQIIVDHEYYGKITFTETTQQGQMNVTRDLYLPFPAGMRTTRGIEMGGPLRG